MADVIDRDNLLLLLDPVLLVSHVPVELPQLTAIFKALPIYTNKDVVDYEMYTCLRIIKIT